MPRIGQTYQHKQIKGEYYRVDSVDSSKRGVYLTNEHSKGQIQWVTFDQLKNNYKKVG